MTSERSFHSGAAYRNGKLYEFSGHCVIVMKGWPEMRAWQWTGIYARPWRHVRPRLKRISLRGLSRMPDPDSQPPEAGGQMLFPFAYSHVARNAYRAFWWAVPEAYRGLVMPFRDRRWHMLSLLARCPGAGDLAVGNPALAFCLASNWAFHWPVPTHPLRAARSLVYKKQRRILEWLGFPATESVRQIIRRVPPESMTVEFLLSLREALHHPECLRPLSFMGRITEDVFEIATNPGIATSVSFPLLEEMSLEPRPDKSPGYARRIRDVHGMSEVLHRKMPRLHSLAQLNQLHDEWVWRMNLRTAANEDPFPPPPLPGKDGEIEPLVSGHDLAMEGREQQHCVAGYAHAVLQGETYIYRMLKPERATLAIVWGSTGWLLGEIRGVRNAPVRPESLCAAWNWLGRLSSDVPAARAGPLVLNPVGMDEIPF